MDTREDNDRFSFRHALHILALIGLIYLNWLVMLIPPPQTTPTTSHQEQNLAALKSTQPKDLVLCVAKKGSASQEEIKFAFLVEQNMGAYMTGYYPSQYTLSRSDGESFALLSEWKCKMRIFRPSENKVASNTLASIILGLKFEPPK